ncbi:MAG: 16S rRNA (uracil(1498)-N(3))-methyltransferase [Pirellulales bacterium]|nr:16S rRNA (uracil(1498)-N(3))-methyltransferase [Pirellulales bacterium]
MSERFFSSQPISSELVTLEGPEAHHLLNVMRAGVGTMLSLFDGTGAEYSAVVESTRRGEAVIRILERRVVDRELSTSIVVGVALPKGDRQKWLVEKLTELGVAELVPLITERGVAQPTASAVERLERAVIEAAKQCGRNRLMRLASPRPWADWVRGVQAQSSEGLRLVAHPGGERRLNFELSSALPVMLAVGPEGGLTGDEVAIANSAGWVTVSLGDRILRVETAAVALVAACSIGRE